LVTAHFLEFVPLMTLVPTLFIISYQNGHRQPSQIEVYLVKISTLARLSKLAIVVMATIDNLANFANVPQTVTVMF